MGDMVDDFLNDVMDSEDERLEWMTGNMSTEEAIDKGVIDESGTTPNPTSSKTCMFCNTSGLHWKLCNKKWVLFHSNNHRHICPKKSFNTVATTTRLKKSRQKEQSNKNTVLVSLRSLPTVQRTYSVSSAKQS